ncbi:MAG TPA: TetR/AcrR family transcriptional regulator [Mycobacteriales bacterium]
MPTGVRLRDARQQLFDAAERVLVRGGAGALTSRAVTDEAGCAKGVLHRHFADFDAFLTDLVLDRATRLTASTTRLHESVGSATMVENLTVALTELFGPVPAAIVPLITFRGELRTRLRQATPGGGIAVLSHATAAVSAYLAAERDLGRITADADIDSLTLSLVGGGHLLTTSRERAAALDDQVVRLVTAVIIPVSAVP